MNQYRCETCTHYDDDDERAACNVREEWISNDVWNWINVVGCASHSDFQSKRDKVLDEFIDIGNSCGHCDLLDNCPIVTKIEELRQQAGERSMNQYIITEDELYRLLKGKKSDGEVLAFWEKDEIIKNVHSHPYQSEREKVLDGRKLYQCNSDTCSDSGGVCILCIPDMDFSPPTSCVNPEAFTDNGDEPDCKWEELRYQAGEL
jgi:hypothetical protein